MSGISPPLNDILRVIRSGMTAGRIAITPFREIVPPPVRGFVGDLVSGVDFFANKVDRASSFVARNFMDSDRVWRRDGCWTLGELAARPDGDSIFAPLAHGVLRSAYRRFATGEFLVSEMRASLAFSQAVAVSDRDHSLLPVELLRRLLDGEVIHRAPFGEPVEGEAARLSAIALILWLLADRTPQTEDNDLLDVCCDAAGHIDRHLSVETSDPAAIVVAISECARLI